MPCMALAASLLQHPERIHRDACVPSVAHARQARRLFCGSLLADLPALAGVNEAACQCAEPVRHSLSPRSFGLRCYRLAPVRIRRNTLGPMSMASIASLGEGDTRERASVDPRTHVSVAREQVPYEQLARWLPLIDPHLSRQAPRLQYVCRVYMNV